MDSDKLWDKFNKYYKETGLKKGIYQAPGRVNIIGEHTDYNNGFVLPMAIDKKITFASQIRSDNIINVYSLDYDEEFSFSINNIKFNKDKMWANYIIGVVSEIKKLGKNLKGADIVFGGNIPQGAGLSSSAALEVGTAYMFDDLNKLNISPKEQAFLSQRAENDFVGVKCGIMDQFVSRLGRKGHLLLLDCKTNEYELIPFKSEKYIFLIIDSKVDRELTNSEYNKRREECEAAVEFYNKRLDKNVESLRGVNLSEIKKYENEMDKTLYKRAKHVVSENHRVLKSVEALKDNNFKKLGELMNRSHISLSRDYEVSSKELDLLVKLASKESGVIGARMTGAGFGGCTVNLVEKDAAFKIIENVRAGYKAVTSLEADFYLTKAEAGAKKFC
ncbi:MAG: galactokinase [Bacillota bacterium]